MPHAYSSAHSQWVRNPNGRVFGAPTGTMVGYLAHHWRRVFWTGAWSRAGRGRGVVIPPNRQLHCNLLSWEGRARLNGNAAGCFRAVLKKEKSCPSTFTEQSSGKNDQKNSHILAKTNQIWGKNDFWHPWPKHISFLNFGQPAGDRPSGQKAVLNKKTSRP